MILEGGEGGIVAGTESEEPASILKALREKYKDAAFVLTLGEQGGWYGDPEETAFQDIFRVEAVDTTAAGDTFCGYFIAGIAGGLGHKKALLQASAAAALAVTKKGAAPSVPEKSAVEAFIWERA